MRDVVPLIQGHRRLYLYQISNLWVHAERQAIGVLELKACDLAPGGWDLQGTGSCHLR